MKRTYNDGFLLMEALLAIIVTASFSAVIGYYICSISQVYAQNKNIIQALQYAISIADDRMAGKTDAIPVSAFQVKVDHKQKTMPRILAGPVVSLEPLELITVSIAWEGMPAWQEIKIPTIAAQA